MKKYKNKRIAVLYGGWSNEREISLKTGQAVLSSLISQGFNAFGIELHSHNLDRLNPNDMDIAYIALHGKGGEDGFIQAYLDMKNIQYTGTNAVSSSICMDKYWTKKILDASGIPTPKYEKISTKNAYFEDLTKKFGIPFVLKAIASGSALDVYIVKNKTAFETGLKNISKNNEFAMVEKYIKGREFTVGIVGDLVLPVIEITTNNQFYDFDAKYSDGKSQHIFPKDLKENILQKMQDLALQTHKELGCKAVSRVDFMMDEKNNIFVLEINTIPGMTKTSLLPDACKQIGISFDELVVKILDASM